MEPARSASLVCPPSPVDAPLARCAEICWFNPSNRPTSSSLGGRRDQRLRPGSMRSLVLDWGSEPATALWLRTVLIRSFARLPGSYARDSRTNREGERPRSRNSTCRRALRRTGAVDRQSRLWFGFDRRRSAIQRSQTIVGPSIATRIGLKGPGEPMPTMRLTLARTMSEIYEHEYVNR